MNFNTKRINFHAIELTTGEKSVFLRHSDFRTDLSRGRLLAHSCIPEGGLYQGYNGVVKVTFLKKGWLPSINLAVVQKRHDFRIIFPSE